MHPDGFVALRDAGDVHVANLPVTEFRAKIIEAYAKVLREPDVAVTLKEFTKPSFIVGGIAVGTLGARRAG